MGNFGRWNDAREIDLGIRHYGLGTWGLGAWLGGGLKVCFSGPTPELGDGGGLGILGSGTTPGGWVGGGLGFCFTRPTPELGDGGGLEIFEVRTTPGG